MSIEAKGPSLSRRRSSGTILTPLRMSPPEIPELLVMEGDLNEKAEVVEEGEELFRNFLYEEIQKETTVELNEVFSSQNGLKNPIWTKAGLNLREMADQFARTKERRRVRQQAQEMGVNVSYAEFRELLTQLFSEGGVTRERIVVLFYFCSDVAINALRTGKDLFNQFLSWSLSFIVEHVCSWVHRQGGWGQVLKSPFNSVYKIGVWITASVLFVYLGVRYFRPRRI